MRDPDVFHVTKFDPERDDVHYQYRLVDGKFVIREEVTPMAHLSGRPLVQQKDQWELDRFRYGDILDLSAARLALDKHLDTK